jgi:hypothetical protein
MPRHRGTANHSGFAPALRIARGMPSASRAHSRGVEEGPGGLVFSFKFTEPPDTASAPEGDGEGGGGYERLRVKI